jgi:hypothetical protein
MRVNYREIFFILVKTGCKKTVYNQRYDCLCIWDCFPYIYCMRDACEFPFILIYFRPWLHKRSTILSLREFWVSIWNLDHKNTCKIGIRMTAPSNRHLCNRLVTVEETFMLSYEY